MAFHGFSDPATRQLHALLRPEEIKRNKKNAKGLLLGIRSNGTTAIERERPIV